MIFYFLIEGGKQFNIQKLINLKEKVDIKLRVYYVYIYDLIFEIFIDILYFIELIICVFDEQILICGTSFFKDESVDWYFFGVFLFWVDDGVLGRRVGEAGVGVGSIVWYFYFLWLFQLVSDGNVLEEEIINFGLYL